MLTPEDGLKERGELGRETAWAQDEGKKSNATWEMTGMVRVSALPSVNMTSET